MIASVANPATSPAKIPDAVMVLRLARRATASSSMTITDTLLVHHMGHANERARGDSRLQDWPDAIWRIVRETEEPGSPRYFTAYGREVNILEGRLGFDEATRRLTYAAGSRLDAKTEAAQRAVIELLAAMAKGDPDAGTDRAQHLSMNQIESELSGDGHPRRAVRDALMHGIHRGLLTRIDGPRAAKLHRIARPCAGCGWPLTAGQESRHESCSEAGEQWRLL